VIKPSVTIVDSAETTATAVQKELRDRALLNPANISPRPILQATDSPERFARVGSRFLGETFDASQVELVDLN
jgi:glutamate racemase